MMFGIRMIPYGMRYVAEAIVAVRNVQAVLMSIDEQSARAGPPANRAVLVDIVDAHFAWKTGATSATDATKSDVTKIFELFDIRLSCQRQELIGICGPIASGKSALLAAIVGQMHCRQSQRYTVTDSCAVVTQQPWLLNASVRDNVLFGSAFDEQRYYRVLHAVGLTQDVAALASHDHTPALQLSGGQKQRVCLARAVYAQKQLLCVDDVLSALDAPTAAHVFANVFVPQLAQQSAVVAVLSQPQLLAQCTRVLYMVDGRVMATGTHDHLLHTCDAYRQMMQEASTHDVDYAKRHVADSVDMHKVPALDDSTVHIPGALDGSTMSHIPH